MLQVDIPEGQKGPWKVEKFIITEKDMNSFIVSKYAQGIREGTYTRLLWNGHIIMSDTPSEMNDHRQFVYRSYGNVLINGLGLGMVLKNVLAKSEVKLVVVNEISKDVIDLVSPYYQDSRLVVNNVDAYTWKPTYKLVNGEKLDAIWHDIWPNKCTDNIEGMKKLHRRYSHWLSPDGFQMSWAREELEYIKKRDNRQRWR